MAQLPDKDLDWIEGELGRRGVKFGRPCDECGNNTWEGQLQLGMLPTAKADISSADPAAAFGIFIISCGNCGNLRSFLPSTLGYEPGIGSK
jgi:hypothetical protein